MRPIGCEFKHREKERWREWSHELNDEQKMGVELYDEGWWGQLFSWGNLAP